PCLRPELTIQDRTGSFDTEQRLAMNTIVLYDDEVRIPDGIKTLAAFRRWAHSDDFPQTGRTCFLDGQVWLDMSKEQIFTHNQVKQEFNLVVGLGEGTPPKPLFS